MISPLHIRFVQACGCGRRGASDYAAARGLLPGRTQGVSDYATRNGKSVLTHSPYREEVRQAQRQASLTFGVRQRDASNHAVG